MEVALVRRNNAMASPITKVECNSSQCHANKDNSRFAYPSRGTVRLTVHIAALQRFWPRYIAGAFSRTLMSCEWSNRRLSTLGSQVSYHQSSRVRFSRLVTTSEGPVAAIWYNAVESRIKAKNVFLVWEHKIHRALGLHLHLLNLGVAAGSGTPLTSSSKSVVSGS